MSMLHEVMTYLKANGFGAYGSAPGVGQIWAGQMPATPDVVVVVSEYGGPNVPYRFGQPGLIDEMPGLQIRTRGAANAFQEPDARLRLIFVALSKIQGLTLTSEAGTGLVSSSYYRMLHPVQSNPAPLEVEANGRRVFVVNFLVDKRISA